MGSKMVRLDEDVYERIKAEKQDDETFSEAIARLTAGYTLLDFAGGWTEADVEAFEEIQEQAEARNRADRAEDMEQLQNRE